MTARIIGALAACVVLAAAAPAGAQPSRGTWELSGGGVFVGGYDLGSATAELTSNTGTSGGPFTFFETDNRVESVSGFVARVGYYVTPAVAVEGGLRFTRPRLASRISADVESAPNITAEETIDQYVFDGSLVWHFGQSTGRRGNVAPFVYGGAGYLRELHEGDALVEEGTEYHAGGGIKWWFGARGRMGIRAEAGLSIRDGGFDFEEKTRIAPVAAGSFIWVF